MTPTVPTAAYELTMTVLMTPDMANFSGNVHGGMLLKLLDQVAYACHVGELVTFLASVNDVGTSSMEVGIKVRAENIRTQQARHVNSCFFTMVAVDKRGKKVSAPAWTPRTHEQLRRSEQARLRRQLPRDLQVRFDLAAPVKPFGTRQGS